MLDTDNNFEIDLSFTPIKRIKWGRPVNEIKTERSNRKRYQHKKRYNSKKPERDLKPMDRECIGYGRLGGERCGQHFTAKGRFHRLCDRCRKWADDNG